MKQRIILISGFGGSGKTTTGEMLQEKLINCARLEPDFLILIKPFEIGEKLSRIKMQNTIAVVSNFVKEQFENILVIGGIWSQQELDLFLKYFSIQEFDISIFWLHARKEERFRRAFKRGDPGDNEEWLEKVEQAIPYPSLPLQMDGGMSYKIEVENKTPDEVVNEVLSHLS